MNRGEKTLVIAALLYMVLYIIDEAGRRLGDFVPARIAAPGDDCPYSPEELDQIQSEQGSRRLKEIWKSLDAK